MQLDQSICHGYKILNIVGQNWTELKQNRLSYARVDNMYNIRYQICSKKTTINWNFNRSQSVNV